MSGRPVWYGGIADTDGLESCVFLYDQSLEVAEALAGQQLGPENNKDSVGLLNALELRARYNPQRHAQVYTALLSRKDAAKIGELLAASPYKAYWLLQELAEEVRIHVGSPDEFGRLPQIAKAMGDAWNR